MLSALHEAPLVLIREDPFLVPRLLRDASGLELPEGVVARVADANATEVVPRERHADAVVTLEDATGAIVTVLVIEVQLAVDAEKRFSWPLYLASIHARHRCSAHLVVMTPFENVASWAAQPIPTFHPRSGFAPIVLGPRQIPRVMDLAGAARSPELALLSALVHGGEPGGDRIVDAALRAAASLDEDHAKIYSDLTVAILGEAIRPILERVMPYLHGYTLKSDWAKQHFAEGEIAGSLHSARRAVIQITEARGFALSPEALARLEACTDIAVLEGWQRRAVIATDESQIW